MNKNVEIKLDNNLALGKMDVPYHMLSGMMHIDMFGNRRINFEGKYKILEYSSEIVKIKSKSNLVSFSGSELTISNIQKTSFFLCGKISSVVFE